MELTEDVAVEITEGSEVAAPALPFEAFFADHHARLFSALCATTGNRQEAEELMQEARGFLRVRVRLRGITGGR